MTAAARRACILDSPSVGGSEVVDCGKVGTGRESRKYLEEWEKWVKREMDLDIGYSVLDIGHSTVP